MASHSALLTASGPFELELENLAFFFLVFGFGTFVAYCRARDLFSSDNYYSVVGKTHLVFALLCTASFLVTAAVGGHPVAAVATHSAAVLFLFFLAHYGFFHQAVGLVKKSVSLNLLLLMNSSQATSVDQLLANYADGRGAEFLVRSRVEQMRALGWIEKQGEFWVVSSKGFQAIRRYRFLKRLFGVQSPLEKG